MWKNLSLRMRLVLPLGTMFLAALLLGGISLQIFAPGQLMEENEPPTRSAKVVAEALNSALLISDNPQQTLDAFVQSLGSSENIRFRRAGVAEPAHAPVEVRTPLGRVPHWFVHLMGLPEISAAFPVTIKGKQAGDIVFSPDITADIYPYIAASTALSACLPPWVLEGGTEKMLSRLRDQRIRQQLKKEIVTDSKDWENIYLGSGGAGSARRRADAPHRARRCDSELTAAGSLVPLDGM